MRLKEHKFELEFVNKSASQMTIGNGFLGVRGAHEEDYHKQVRGMFVSGLYNRAINSDSSELVNLPDVTKFEIKISGELFSLVTGKVIDYDRYLDMETGELVRKVVWMGSKEKAVEIISRRVVSQENQSLLALKVDIRPLDEECELEIVTGIDGQQTNLGTQQLIEKELRVYDNQYLTAEYETIESNVSVGIAVSLSEEGVLQAKNRQLLACFQHTIKKNEVFSLEKKIAVVTSLQSEFPLDKCHKLLNQTNLTYDTIYRSAVSNWQKFWKNHRVKISSQNEFDQFAIDFSCYHLAIMTPRADSRFSVGAKGLTGEGYKGHVFWDTEIFILPFFLHNQPEIAKNLLMYRYNNLAAAKEKAKQENYEGALFPWESAFSGDEETPKYAAINIRTGKRQKVASAIAEHHIVADIAYAVVEYVKSTDDQLFMDEYGRELLKETAKFWLSRGAKRNDRIEILDVIGPDEYTEHIDNNAYTNYMAYFNVKQAVKYNPEDFNFIKAAEAFLSKLYLPQPNGEMIIPQDDTFLEKSRIDLSGYKKKQGTQAILLDYSRPEVNELQILKQADLVMLFYLQPTLFSSQVIKKNLFFYEDRTIHDSSLSKAIHAIEISRFGNSELAYQFFREACLIDLGPEPHSSDEGVHAASLGAIWLTIIFGFAGIDKSANVLKMSPVLPMAWKDLSFYFMWKQEKIQIEINAKNVILKKDTSTPLEIVIDEKSLMLVHEIIYRR